MRWWHIRGSQLPYTVSVSGGYQMLWNQGRHQQQQSSKWTRLAQQCIDVSIINWRSARCNTALTTSLSHYRCISESKTKCKRYAATWKPLLAVLTSTQWSKNKPPSLTIVWHIPKESTRPLCKRRLQDLQAITKEVTFASPTPKRETREQGKVIPIWPKMAAEFKFSHERNKNDSSVTLTREGQGLTGRAGRHGLGQDSKKLGFPKEK